MAKFSKAEITEDSHRLYAGKKPRVLPSLGGKARSKALSSIRRSEIARKAARARWANPNTRTRWTDRKTSRDQSRNTEAA